MSSQTSTCSRSSTRGCCRHPWYKCCCLFGILLLSAVVTLYFLFFHHKTVTSTSNILLNNDRMNNRYTSLSSSSDYLDAANILLVPPEESSSTITISPTLPTTVIPYLIPLPYQAHSFNDVDNWFSLILKGIQWFKVDVSVCLRDSCLRYSTFNTFEHGSLQECVDLRLSPTVVESYCCLCLRGDTSSRPSLLTPFSTGWDMVKFFDNDDNQIFFQNLPHNLYFGLNFGGRYGGLQRDISASMVRTWLIALAQVKVQRKLSKIIFYFDNQFNDWFRELDTLCTSTSNNNNNPGCSSNDRSFLQIFSPSLWPSEYPLPFPDLAMDPAQRIQILNMDWNLLSGYCSSSSSPSENDPSSSTTGTTGNQPFIWNTQEMYYRTSRYPYLFWAISSQYEVCSVWDRLYSCEPLLSFIRDKNLLTNNVFQRLYLNTIENNVRLVSNQNPEMFEIMSASRLLYRGMNHPFDPRIVTNALPSSSNSLLLSEQKWTNPFLFLVPTLIKQYDHIAVLILRNRFRPLEYIIRILGYIHNISPSLEKNLLYELRIPSDNQTITLPIEMLTVVSVQLVQHYDIIQEEDMDIRVHFAILFRSGRIIIYQINRATGEVILLWSRYVSVIQENYANLIESVPDTTLNEIHLISFGLLTGTVICTGKFSRSLNPLSSLSYCYLVAIIGETIDHEYGIHVYPLYQRNNNNNVQQGSDPVLSTALGSGIEIIDEDSVHDEQILSLMTHTEAMPIATSSLQSKLSLPFRVPVDGGMTFSLVPDITATVNVNTLSFTGLFVYSRYTTLPTTANEGFTADGKSFVSSDQRRSTNDNLNRVFIVEADSSMAETIESEFDYASKSTPLPSNAPPRLIFPSLQDDLRSRSELYGASVDVSLQFGGDAVDPVVRIESFTPLQTTTANPIRIGFGARPQLSLRIHEKKYIMVLLVATHSDCDGGLYLNNGNINKCHVIYPLSDNDALYTPLQSVPYLLTYSYGILNHWRIMLDNNNRYRSNNFISTLNIHDQYYWYNQLLLNNCNHRIMHGKLETGSFISAVLYQQNTLQFTASDGMGKGEGTIVVPEIAVLALHDGVIGGSSSNPSIGTSSNMDPTEPEESILTAFYCAPTERKPYLVWDSWRLVQPHSLENIAI